MDFKVNFQGDATKQEPAGNRADVIIIGGGPAGLTAALYNSRAGFSVIVLEKLAAGGQIFTTAEIENYPGIANISGPELTQVMETQAKNFGAKIVFEEVLSIKDAGKEKEIECASGVMYKADAVILATGAKYRDLNVPGEQQFRGRGVSNCATCDGAFYRNMEVAVVGGGDTAVEEGIFLTKFASKVYVIHRRDRLRASKIIQDRAYASGKMEFVFDSVVEEIKGGKTVESLVLKNVKTGEKRELKTSGVFVFIGLVPWTSFLQGYVELDEGGYIKIGKGMETSRPGVFACGDCTDKHFRQAITAAGDGANAAFAAQHYIDKLRGTEYV